MPQEVERCVVSRSVSSFSSLSSQSRSGWSWTWPLGGRRPSALLARARSVRGRAAPWGRRCRSAKGDGSAPAAGVVSFAGIVPGSGRTVTIQAVRLYRLLDPSRQRSRRARVRRSPREECSVSPDRPASSEWPSPYVHLGIRTSDAADGYVDPLTLLPPRAVIPPPSATQPVAPAVVAPTQPTGATNPETTPAPPSPVVPAAAPAAAPDASSRPAPAGDATTPTTIPATAPTVVSTRESDPASPATSRHRAAVVRGASGRIRSSLHPECECDASASRESACEGRRIGCRCTCSHFGGDVDGYRVASRCEEPEHRSCCGSSRCTGLGAWGRACRPVGSLDARGCCRDWPVGRPCEWRARRLRMVGRRVGACSCTPWRWVRGSGLAGAPP